jgi:hypothetical protein
MAASSTREGGGSTPFVRVRGAWEPFYNPSPQRDFSITESMRGIERIHLVPCPYCVSMIAPEINECPQCQRSIPTNQVCPICVKPLSGTEFHNISGYGYHPDCVQAVFRFPIKINCILCKNPIIAISSLADLCSKKNHPLKCSSCGKANHLNYHACDECGLPVYDIYARDHDDLGEILPASHKLCVGNGRSPIDKAADWVSTVLFGALVIVALWFILAVGACTVNFFSQ